MARPDPIRVVPFDFDSQELLARSYTGWRASYSPDASASFARASRNTWTILYALCLSNSISLCVNMRGLGDLPSLSLRRAVEGVSWLVPVLAEVVSVLVFLLAKLAPGPVTGMEQTATGVAVPAEKQRASNRYGKTQC